LLDSNLKSKAIKELPGDSNCVAIGPLHSRSFRALGMSPAVALALWSNRNMHVSLCNEKLADVQILMLPSHHGLSMITLTEIGEMPHFVRAGAGYAALSILDRGNDGIIKTITSRVLSTGFHPAQITALIARDVLGVDTILLFCCADDACVARGDNGESTTLQLAADETQDWTHKISAPLTDQPGLAVACYDGFSIFEFSASRINKALNLPLVGKPYLTCVNSVLQSCNSSF